MCFVITPSYLPSLHHHRRPLSQSALLPMTVINPPSQPISHVCTRHYIIKPLSHRFHSFIHSFSRWVHAIPAQPITLRPESFTIPSFEQPCRPKDVQRQPRNLSVRMLSLLRDPVLSPTQDRPLTSVLLRCKCTLDLAANTEHVRGTNVFLTILLIGLRRMTVLAFKPSSEPGLLRSSIVWNGSFCQHFGGQRPKPTLPEIVM